MNQHKFFYIIASVVVSILLLDSILTSNNTISNHVHIIEGYSSSWDRGINSGSFLYAVLDEHQLILYGRDSEYFRADSIQYTTTPILNTPKTFFITANSQKYTNNFILTNSLVILCLISWFASIRFPEKQTLSVGSMTFGFLAIYIFFAM